MDQQFLIYSALDSACTLEIRNAFWDKFEAEGFRPAYDATVRMANVTAFMETRGIRVDLSGMDALRKELAEEQAKLQEELNTIVGRELNINSPKQVAEYFYIEKGVKPYLNPKTHKVTTDDDAMQRLARGTTNRPGLREAKLIQQLRGISKLDGTYLAINLDQDGRLRCSYNLRGTKFGRLSSSSTIRDTGTNLQNLPPTFKRFCWADPEYTLIEFDKAQAEWVVVAYLSNDAHMIRAIEEGKDIHVVTATMMFKLPEEVIKLDEELIGSASDEQTIIEIRLNDPILSRYIDTLPRTMSARQMGKKSNHGLNYDEQYRMFALSNEILEREAKRIINLYHSGYPGIRGTFHAGVQAALRKDRSLTNCFGRRIQFLDSWGPDLFKSAYSAIPQSTVVDSLNQGICEVYESELCSINGWNIDLLAQVHDSILTQFPIKYCLNNNLQAALSQIYHSLSPTLSYSGKEFKIKTDMKIGLNWGGYHPVNNPFGMRKVKDAQGIVEFLKGLEHGGKGVV